VSGGRASRGRISHGWRRVSDPLLDLIEHSLPFL